MIHVQSRFSTIWRTQRTETLHDKSSWEVDSLVVLRIYDPRNLTSMSISLNQFRYD